jgi:hypothetical protein
MGIGYYNYPDPGLIWFQRKNTAKIANLGYPDTVTGRFYMDNIRMAV